MKKLRLVAAIALVMLLSGCAGKAEKAEKAEKAAAEPVTVTLWHYYNDDIKAQFDELVRQFNETVGAEKGILVDAYSQGGVNELADALYASAIDDVGSSPMPDMFAAYSDSAYRLDELGKVAALDEYFTEEELKTFRPEFIEDGRFSPDQSLKIIPIAKSTELLYINGTDFEKFSEQTGASPEDLKTWEGLAQTAEKYYEWCGKAFFGIDSMSNLMIIGARQLGTDIIRAENGEISFDLPEESARKLWEIYYVPYLKGYYKSSGRFRSDDVKSGTIVAFIGSSSSASYFPKILETGKDTSYEISSIVLPYPQFDSGEKYCVQQGAGIVVAKSEQRKEEACVEFLKWLTSPENNIQFAAETSYMPVQNESLKLDVTLEAIGTEDKSDVRVQTAEALYQMLEDFTLYACRPFEKSMEVRDMLNTSLSDFVNEDLEAITARMEDGESAEQLYEEYTGEDNFLKWYSSLLKNISLYFNKK